MNGPPHSVYGIRDPAAPRENTPELAPKRDAPSPPRPLPQPTVSRKATVATLREAQAAQRVPIAERVKEPEVPARLKQKRKTIAFGATTNVSQTVEKEKEKDPRESRPLSTTTTTTRPSRMSLARVGVGADRPERRLQQQPLAASRQSPILAAAAAAVVPTAAAGGDENRRPEESREELRMALMKESTRARRAEEDAAECKREIRRLVGDVADCKRETAEYKRQMERLVEMVSNLTRRMFEMEERVTGKGEMMSEGQDGEGGGRRRRNSEEDSRRARRRLHSSDEGERGERGGGGRGAGSTHPRRTATSPYLLSDEEETRRARDTQLLLRKIEDKYGLRNRGRGGAERRANPTNTRCDLFDEVDEPTQVGRGGAAAVPKQRWRDDPGVRRGRVGERSPPAGRGGNRNITPSRRRVTERVTMERVHHFDDTDESDGGAAYERYDSNEQPITQYDVEIVDDFQSVIRADARRHGHPNRTNDHRGGVPVITEMNDSEDSLDRMRRELKERKEARERRYK